MTMMMTAIAIAIEIASGLVVVDLILDATMERFRLGLFRVVASQTLAATGSVGSPWAETRG